MGDSPQQNHLEVTPTGWFGAKGKPLVSGVFDFKSMQGVTVV